MKRLQIYIGEVEDAALAAEANRNGTSKAALIRGYVAQCLPSRQVDPIVALIGMGKGEPVEDIDAVIYEE